MRIELDNSGRKRNRIWGVGENVDGFSFFKEFEDIENYLRSSKICSITSRDGVYLVFCIAGSIGIL